MHDYGEIEIEPAKRPEKSKCWEHMHDYAKIEIALEKRP